MEDLLTNVQCASVLICWHGEIKMLPWVRVCESADAPGSFKSITWISLATWNICHFPLHLYKWVERKAWARVAHRDFSFHFSPLCFSWHILPKRPIVWNHEPIISPWQHQDAFVTTISWKRQYLHVPKNQNASSVLAWFISWPTLPSHLRLPPSPYPPHPFHNFPDLSQWNAASALSKTWGIWNLKME